MLLQKIIFSDDSSIADMFYRCSDNKITTQNTSVCGGGVRLCKNEVISFDTYFNSFSVGRWLEYTKISNLYFSFYSKQKISVEFFKAKGSKDSSKIEEIVETYPVRCNADIESFSNVVTNLTSFEKEPVKFNRENSKKDGVFRYCIELDNIESEEILYPVLTALEDADIQFIGWESDVNEKDLIPLRIALGICTYKREEFVKCNVEKIRNLILKKTKSPLFDKLEVYISDNGQTLSAEEFNSEKIHLFSNKNLGGAGGFTRTMIESLFNDREKAFTHIIFMDDDIELPISTLERTYALLSLVKDKYRYSLLGGAMLLLENKNLQMEFGAKFDGECEFKINNRFFNLSCFSAVCANYSASDINYTGWWYCCIPSCIVTEKNLPMPYFIHLDDIEYGMRNYNNGIILLNGISVWHPSFVNKSPLWYGYYDMRNQLLTCSMTDYFNAMTLYSAYFKNKSFWDVIDMMIFRHQTFVWLLHIMKCFCKGPETLLNLDALTLQKELTLCKLETASLEDYGFTKEDIVAPSLRKKRIARLLLVLCSLLPFRHGVKLVSSYNLDYPFFCKKLYIYHEENKLCECLNFSRLSMKRKLILYFYHYFNIRLKWKSLVLQWKRSREVFTSIEFWKKYLGI